MKTYQIHLIRHGTAQGTLRGEYIGVTDSPLAQAGRDELQKLKEKTGYPQAEAYYSSPLLRCLQTMHILYPEKDCFSVPALREIDFGDWEGKTAGELKGDAAFEGWLKNGGEITPPNGESNLQFAQRVCAGFENIADNMMKTGTRSAVIITHGGVIMTLLAAYGLPKAAFYDWMTSPGYGYSLRLTPSLWMSGRVAEVYDTIPAMEQRDETEDRNLVIELGREAADRAFRKEEKIE